MKNKKEEILQPLIEHYSLTERAKQRFDFAMNEFAKEVAVAFVEWKEENTYRFNNGAWVCFASFLENGHDFTTEELFNKFLSEQQLIKQ